MGDNWAFRDLQEPYHKHGHIEAPWRVTQEAEMGKPMLVVGDTTHQAQAGRMLWCKQNFL